MSVFIHFQHFMEDSIASPIELQQVMYVLTNFVYIYEYKQTLWIPVLNCKINSAAVLSKTVPWDLFSFSYCIICKHIHALTPKGSRQGREYRYLWDRVLPDGCSCGHGMKYLVQGRNGRAPSAAADSWARARRRCSCLLLTASSLTGSDTL